MEGMRHPFKGKADGSASFFFLNLFTGWEDQAISPARSAAAGNKQLY
jgi:hypothetical protein